MRTFLTLALFCFAFTALGQKLERDEVDKYLKTKVKETSWEPLAMPFMNALRCRCTSADDKTYIELKITAHSGFRVDEGNKVYFLLDNEESLPLTCVRGGIAKYDYDPAASFWYGSFLYLVTEEDKKKLMEHKVTGARVDLADKYLTFDKVKEKNALKLQKALTLVSQ